jgi:uncharacterized protein (TIGR03067 family)
MMIIQSLNLTGAALRFRAAQRHCSGPGKLARSFRPTVLATEVTCCSLGHGPPVAMGHYCLLVAGPFIALTSPVRLPRRYAMKMRALLVLSVGLLLAADGPNQDVVKDEVKNLQGTWKVVSAERDGKKATQEEIKDFKWIITADKITWTDKGKNAFLYKLAPAEKPRRIDLMFPERKETEKDITRGIYSLEGDALKVCLKPKGEGRPTEFTGKAGSGLLLFVLKREKPQ